MCVSVCGSCVVYMSISGSSWEGYEEPGWRRNKVAEDTGQALKVFGGTL